MTWIINQFTATEWRAECRVGSGRLAGAERALQATTLYDILEQIRAIAAPNGGSVTCVIHFINTKKGESNG